MDDARIYQKDKEYQEQHAAAYAEHDRNMAASIDMSLSEYQSHQQAMNKESKEKDIPIQNTAAFQEFRRRAYITSKGKPAY